MDIKRHSPGFTLIEFAIVIAVIGILFLIAVPNVGPFSNGYRLRGATREIATDLQFARVLSIKENQDFRVTFSSNAYQVIRVADGNAVKNRSFSASYPGVTLTSVSVTFDSRGTLDPSKNSGANSITVSVSNPGGTKNIRVARGRVKIE